MRAGGLLPKQFCMLGGRPVITYSIDRFRKFDPQCHIIVVLHKDYFDWWQKEFREDTNGIYESVYLVEGGDTRIESVKNGIWKARELRDKDLENKDRQDRRECDIVFIHDGARPFLTIDMLKNGVSNVGRNIGAIPVIPLTDSIRTKREGGKTQTVDRSQYVAVQTPQIFLLEDIGRAYSSIVDSDGLTDDASVAEKNNIEIVTYPGSQTNIKITYPMDFVVAETLLHKEKFL